MVVHKLETKQVVSRGSFCRVMGSYYYQPHFLLNLILLVKQKENLDNTARVSTMSWSNLVTSERSVLPLWENATSLWDVASPGIK